MKLAVLFRFVPLALGAALSANAAAVVLPLTSASEICYGLLCLSGATLTPGTPTVTQGDGAALDVNYQFSTSPITLTAQISFAGSPVGPLVGTGTHGVIIANRPALTSTGLFAIEIVALDLVSQGIFIRESPSRPSFGQTLVTDLGSGNYQIDSFFDIFTEISLDGIQWVPDNNQTTGAHFQSQSFNAEVPEPSTMLLVSAAGLILLVRRRHA